MVGVRSCRTPCQTILGWGARLVASRMRTASWLLVGLFVGGCAGTQVHPASPEQTFLFQTTAGSVQVVVAATPAEAPGEIDSAWGEAATLGAIYAPLGLVAPPMAASGLVVGGGFLLVLAGTAYGIEAGTVSSVAQALQEADFPEAVADGLRMRGSRLASTEAIPVANATVALEAWGVVSQTGKASGRHCFVAAVTLSAGCGDRPAEITRVELAVAPGPGGMAPAQCASLGKFAAEGGRLVREAARDYAELLAVVIGERLEGLRCNCE